MWVVWEEWNPCSATCGNGERTRYRACKGGRPGDRGCEKDGDFDVGECRADIECPRYEHWLTWEKCSASCHGGTRKRERSCLKFAEWQKCVPEDIEEPPGSGQGSTDSLVHVPLDPSWSLSGPFIPESGNFTLVDTVQHGECGMGPCPYWGEWGEWDTCTVTCGGGVEKRTRGCEDGVMGDIGCSNINPELAIQHIEAKAEQDQCFKI